MSRQNPSPPQWPDLLELALSAIDSLGKCEWTWGGGTALAIHLGHRVSFDIDIFLTDSNSLRDLSPQRNAVVRHLSDNWQEPGHYIKIERPEGEIVFIVSRIFTEPGFRPWAHDGRDLPLETTAEILAKKLHWRGSNALARDVFDLAAARMFDPGGFREAVSGMPDGARRMADQIRRRIARLKRELPLAVRPTENGEAVLDTDLLELAADLETPGIRS